MKYKNGREIKADDAVVGTDWRNCAVAGKVVTGDPAKGHPKFVFQHGVHGTVCPSLALENFLHAEDANKQDAGETPGGAQPAARSPAPATAAA